MVITKLETTFIPQTPEGWIFADEYERKLKAHLFFRGRKEDTQHIMIKAEYSISVKDGDLE